MDLGFITEHYIPIVTIACLIVGYCIKHIDGLSIVANDYIPLIMASLGGILGCVAIGPSLESVVYGALSGVASTGLHQLFTKTINKNNS